MIDLTLPQARAALESFPGDGAELIDLIPLAGGASRASWKVTWQRQSGTVIQVIRQDMGGTIHEDALTREQEHRLIGIAMEAGVAVPKPHQLCTDESILGAPFFLMDFVPGESVGRRIVKLPALEQARLALPKQMAKQLALIHSIPIDRADLDFLPRASEMSPALAAVVASGELLERLGEPHPALELARRWLLQNAPECKEQVLCHGDFRIGNLMVDSDGLVAVLDWEFAHCGDPVEDLAWPCVRSWRFGNDHLALGGIAAVDPFLDEYATLSGRDRSQLEAKLKYFEILGNFRWAVGCIQQAHRHLSGQADSIELLSLGRRTAEVEAEILSLVEEQCT